MGGLSLIIGIVSFFIWILVVMAIFKISSSTHQTSTKLDRVIELLEKQQKTNDQ